MVERLALIGAGVIGKRHLLASRKSSKTAIVAIVDPGPDARVFAASEGLDYFGTHDAMFDKIAPSGVIVATPNNHHFEPTVAALNLGCHVLVEKPIMATLDEAEQVCAMSEATARHVLVGHHRRYYPQIEKARELIQSGALGRLVAVSGMWCVRKPDSYYGPEFRQLVSSGPVMTNLIHEIDYLCYICGPIVSVQAETNNHVQGFAKEDVASLVIKFASGALGAFVLSDQGDSPWAWEFGSGENPAFPKSGQNSIRFVGTKGALDFPNLCLWSGPVGEENWNGVKSPTQFPLDYGDAYLRQIDHFGDVISRAATPLVSARDATETLRTTLSVLQAAATGTRVVL